MKLKSVPIDSIEDEWRQLYARSDLSIGGIEATSSFEFCKTIRNCNKDSIYEAIYALEEDGEFFALIPLAGSIEFRPIKHKMLTFFGDRQFSDGRMGVIGDIDKVGMLPSGFMKNLPKADWDVLRLSVCNESEQYRLVMDAVRNGGYRLHEHKRKDVVYFPLPAEDVDYLSTVTSKFRSNINRGIKQLSGCGKIRYEHYFDAIDPDSLLRSICDVEALSWKRQTQTDLCSKNKQIGLYKDLIPAMSINNMFCATIMFLNDLPVSHIFGTVSGSVFSDHKNSHSHELSRHGAGHICRHEHIKYLQRIGVNVFDFMGVVEPYKLTYPGAATYSRVTFDIYNNNLRGWYLYYRSVIRKYIRKVFDLVS